MIKVVLIGYMASGKSTVGKVLAERLGVEFIDLDDYIEAKEKLSITKIFSEKGEIYFRIKETEYLETLLNSDTNIVLSVGGGTPCYANNIQLITGNSKSFYLNATINTLYNRLKKEQYSRPLIASLKLENLKEFIAKHLFERSSYYNQAQFSISINDKKIDAIVEELMAKLV